MNNVLNRSLSAVVVVVIAFAGARTLQAQTTVLVNAFENRTADRTIDWVGEGLAALITERLNAERQLYVFGRDERAAEYDRMGIPEIVPVSRATAVKIAWEMGADAVVSGSVSGTYEDFRIEVRVLNLVEGNSGKEFGIQGKLDEVVSMAASLASQLARELVPGSTMPESDYVARPPVPRSAFEAYTRGILASDPSRRVELLTDAIRLHPQYPAANYQLGRIHYLDGDYKASASLLEKVAIIPTAPEYAPAMFTIGVDYYNLGDYAKATQAFSVLPPVYDVLVNLGAALAARGDHAGAEAAWSRALARNTTGSEALFNLAYVAFTRSSAETAVSRLRRFLDSHPRDAEALFLLGRLLDKAGQTDDARRIQAQAIRLSPRLERWTSQPIPDIARLRREFNATEVRTAAGSGIWNDARLSRKARGSEAIR